MRLPGSAAAFEFFQVRDAARASAWSKQAIQVGSDAYSDSAVKIASLPAGLSGLDWVRSANGSNAFSGYDVVNFRIDAPGATAMNLFIDTRVTAPWLSDYAWAATGETNTLNNGVALQGYRQFCFQGSMVSLEGLNNSAVSNYIIVAKPTTVPGPTGWARADAIVAAVVPPAFRQVVYNVLVYGAVGNNATNNYTAFKSAEDTCAAEGGGRVLVPAGSYVINGPVEVKSGVRRHLADGAKLFFRGTKSDYLRGTGQHGTTRQIFNGIEYMGAISPILATHAVGVAFAGANPLTCTIDAGGWNGGVGWTNPPSPFVDEEALNGAHVPVASRINVNERPIAVTFQFCTAVWVEGIQITRSPLWCLVPWNCDKVLIKNIRIDSTFHNNDGITSLASNNVVIDECLINPVDDSLSLKSLRNADGFRYCRPVIDLVIQNCTANPNGRRLMEIGTETSGGVKNVFVRNLRTPSATLFNSRIGINMSFMRAGSVEGMSVKNSDCGAFHIWFHSGNDSRYDYANQINFVRYVYFEACPKLTTVSSLTGKGPPYSRPHIDNVRFINCPITQHPPNDPLSFINVDYNATGYGGSPSTPPPTGNKPPTVAITAPASGATYTAPASLSIQVTPSDADGTIASVEFFRNGASIGVGTAAPFTASAVGLSAGTYSFIARATGNGGASTDSAVVTVTVDASSVAAPAVTSQPANATVVSDDGAQFRVVATNSAGTVTSSAATLTVTNTAPGYGTGNPGLGLGTGSLTRDVWTNVSGVTVASIPLASPPSSSGFLTSFEAPINTSNKYGQRLQGYLHSSVSGTYTFWIASDDRGDLWLSGNDNPANAVWVANQIGWTSSREWNKYASQESAPIYVAAGQKCYIRGLIKEAAGGDNLAVSWRLNSTTPANGDGSYIIPGSALSPMQGGTTLPPAETGLLTRRVWNIVAGSSVSSIPQQTPPTSTGSVTSSEAPSNVGSNYGQVIDSYLTPTTSAAYTFWIAGDDNVELQISQNSNPTGATPIAYHLDYTGIRQWNKYSTQKSAPINLVAGQTYYIKALMKETSGGDHLAVARTVGGATPINGTSTALIPASVLSLEFNRQSNCATHYQ